MACYQFQNSGNCNFGAQCRFQHDGAGGQGGAPQPGGDRYGGGGDRFGGERSSYGGGGSRFGGGGGGGGGGPCYQFQESGSCRYGDSCRFQHGAAAGGSAPPQRSYGGDREGGDRFGGGGDRDGGRSGGFGSSWGGDRGGDRGAERSYGGERSSYGGGDRSYGGGGDRSYGGDRGSSFGGRSGGGPGICYSFKDGQCRYGEGCRFSHDLASAGASSGSRYGGDRDRRDGGRDGGSFWSSGPSRGGGGGGAGPCYEFQNNGSCRYGETCRFTHAGAQPQQRDERDGGREGDYQQQPSGSDGQPPMEQQ